MIRFADMFAGIGGFRLGIERAAQKTGVPVECVFSSEIEPNARGIYEQQFGDVPAGDITQISTDDIPGMDLLCGGFPCPSFSCAGNRKGLDDPRGKLFFELCRILRDKQPQYYLFENVRNILTHDKGQTFQKIVTILWELGYSVEWQVLNTRDFGIPQNRERTFLAGHLRGKPGPEIFPIRSSERVYFTSDWGGKEEQEWFWGANYTSTLTRNYSKGVHAGGETYILMNNVLLPEDYDVFYYDSETYEIYKGEPRNDDDERIVMCPYCGCEFASDECDCLGVSSPFELGDHEDVQLRRFTPLEAERLQGFPDGWSKSVSDTARYAALGNAVTVNVIEAIAEKILTNFAT